MIELSEEQRRTLAADDQQPPVVFDREANETYVLVRKSSYERFRHLFEDDSALSKREVAFLVERAMKEYDANDPSLDLYQHD